MNKLSIFFFYFFCNFLLVFFLIDVHGLYMYEHWGFFLCFSYIAFVYRILAVL